MEQRNDICEYDIDIIRFARSGIIRTCIGVMVVALFARLPFLILPGLSIDSYMNLDGWPPRESFISQGRFGQYLVLHALELVGADARAFATLFQTVGLASFALSAPLFFTAFHDGPLRHRPALVLASLVMVLHPFQAEILTFSEASFTALLAISIGIGAVFIMARVPRLWWLAAMLLLAALSLYQLVLNYVCLMLMLGALLAVPHADGRSASSLQAWRTLGTCAALIIACLLVYVLATRFIIAATGVGVDVRGQLLAPTHVGQRLHELRQLGVWLFGHPLLVAQSRVPLFFYWAVMLAGWALMLLRLALAGRQGLVLALLVALAAPLLALGVVLVAASWWPAPRVLGGVVVLFAIACYGLCTASAKIGWRTGCCAPVALIILSCTLVGHRIHADQILLNARDSFMAEQIYEGLRSHPGFTDERLVVVVDNRAYRGHPAPLDTTWMDMNISAFLLPATAQARIALSTTRLLNLRQATDDEVESCGRLPHWPDSGFVSDASDGAAMVCL